MAEEVKFEKAMERLEKIVEDLESGDIDLDEALKKYEEGVKLSRICRERLSQAEKKIEVLTRTMDGTLKKQPFDLQEEEGIPQTSKATRSKPKASPAEDEDEGERLF